MSEIVTVTGASGHIGAHVVRGLLAQGRRVRAIYQGADMGIDGLDVERVRVDITDKDAISRAIAGSDVVYHLAAVISLDPRDEELMRRVNVDGVGNVVQACLTHRVRRLVHFSSIHAYASGGSKVVDERSPLVEQEGVPAYDRSKADGARLVRMGIAKGLDAVLIHPVGVIGPNDRKPSQIGGALVQMTQRKLPALVSGGFNWVDVRDVAAAALSAETRGRKGEHYIVAGQWVSVREIGALVQKATGVAPPRIVTPMWLARAALPFVATYSWVTRTELPYNTASLHALRNHRYISFDKAQRELDHHPRPFEETITDTLNWFREQGLVRV